MLLDEEHSHRASASIDIDPFEAASPSVSTEKSLFPVKKYPHLKTENFKI